MVFWLVLLIPLILSAQDMERIKADPAYLWAEGVGTQPSAADDAALSGLVEKLTATEELPLAPSVRRAVWRTYLPDIRNCSRLIVSTSGLAFRYIAWKDIPAIFDNRWRKSRELVQSAESAAHRGERDVARTYCAWAEVYLASLPPGEEALRQKTAALRKSLGAGNPAAVQMRNVESEVAAIRDGLGTGERNNNPIATRKKDSPVSPSPVQPPEVARVPWERIPDHLQSTIVSPFCQETPSGNALAPVGFHSYPAKTSEAEENWKWRISALAELSRVPSYGVQVAWIPGRLGGYVSFRSSFNHLSPDYSCLSDGTTDFGYIWTSGQARSGRLSGTGGVVLRLSPAFSIFAGGGYADSSVFWEDTAGRWARVSDLSLRGLSAECGVSAVLRRFCVTVGVSSVRLKDCAALLGLGWVF